MNTKKIRLGFAGLGPRVISLLAVYRKHPGIEISAICDLYDAPIINALKVLNDADSSAGSSVGTYKSYDEMVRHCPLDAIFIGIDPQEQVDIACDAMNKGIHVMTEVPCAYTIDQCHNLVSTVKKTGVKYQLAEQTRYWHFIVTWREMAMRGEFGKILLLEGEYMHYEKNWDLFVDNKTGERLYGIPEAPPGRDVRKSWRYKSFEHPIYYLPHTLSPLLSIVGDRVTKISCMGNKLGSYSMEGLQTRDIETAVMYTQKDTILRASAGFTSPHGHRNLTGAHWYQVRGTKAIVESPRNEMDSPTMWTPEEGWRRMDWSTENPDSDNFIKNSGHGGADWWPIDSFVRAIIDDTTPPMDVFKAVETAAPAILAAKSSELGGQLLEVPDFRTV